MATVAAIQAVLDPSGMGTGAQIVKGPLYTGSATLDDYVIRGGADTTGGRRRQLQVTTTRADSAAVQGAAMLAALRAFR